MGTRGKKQTEEVPDDFVSANVPVEFWKPTTPGEKIRGHFQGSRILPAKGKYKEQLVFDIADENGELRVLTGASLVRQFDRIEDGQEVIVVFHGRKELSGGRAPMKDFSVYGKGSLAAVKKID